MLPLSDRKSAIMPSMDPVSCPNCGQENPEDAARCANCGAELPQQPSETKPPAEQWWNSLPFVVALSVVGFVGCCCPMFYLLALMLYWTNPNARPQDKKLATVILLLLAVLGLAFDSGLLLVFGRAADELKKYSVPGMQW